MLAGMVSPGGVVADVGCDHGYLSIWLVQTGICTGALAMDVRKGPLGAAAEHVKECGLEGYIETRLSDGLQSLEAGEADTMVLAGMGGRLMSRIMTEGQDKLKTFRELILQPQSELMEFRRFLRRMGLETVQEAAVAEEGKYYFAMKAVWQGTCREAADGEQTEQDTRVWDRYGRGLLMQGNPVLFEYLLREKDKLEEIAGQLSRADSPGGQARYRELMEEIRDVEYALRLVKQNIDTERVKGED